MYPHSEWVMVCTILNLHYMRMFTHECITLMYCTTMVLMKNILRDFSYIFLSIDFEPLLWLWCEYIWIYSIGGCLLIKMINYTRINLEKISKWIFYTFLCKIHTPLWCNPGSRDHSFKKTWFPKQFGSLTMILITEYCSKHCILLLTLHNYFPFGDSLGKPICYMYKQVQIN